MIHSKTNQAQTILRFYRWSRKSFAPFCSLGHQVIIGHLKNSIADVSMCKQVSVQENEVSLQISLNQEKDSDQEAPPFQQILSQIITLIPVVSIEAAAVSHVHYLSINAYLGEVYPSGDMRFFIYSNSLLKCLRIFKNSRMPFFPAIG